MDNQLEHHPRHLAVIAAAYTSRPLSEEPTIRSAVAFSVISEPEESVRFVSLQHIFEPSTTSEDIAERLAVSIPLGATEMVGQGDDCSRALEQGAIGKQLGRRDILDLLGRVRPDLHRVSLDGRSAYLDEVAAAYSLQRAGPVASDLMRVRHLPVDAQCLWLLYLWAHCHDREREWLISGWLAWRALQKAASYTG